MEASLPRQDLTSGVANLNYLTTETNFVEMLTFYRNVVPFQRAVMLLDDALLQSLPTAGKGLVERARAVGIDLRFVAHTGEPNPVDKIPADIQAVLVAPLPRLKQEDRPAFNLEMVLYREKIALLQPVRRCRGC